MGVGAHEEVAESEREARGEEAGRRVLERRRQRRHLALRQAVVRLKGDRAGQARRYSARTLCLRIYCVFQGLFNFHASSTESRCWRACVALGRERYMVYRSRSKSVLLGGGSNGDIPDV
jgi:hypothetical protein